MTVIQGDGTRYKIRTNDLAGFVCANGYCTIAPPGSTAALPVKSRKEAPVASKPVRQGKPETQAKSLLRPLEAAPRAGLGIGFTPFPALKEVLATAPPGCNQAAASPVLGPGGRGPCRPTQLACLSLIG